MLKFAQFLSIFFHPLFLTFYNFLFLILLTGISGAVLGFVITLFFLTIVIIPLFYTAAVVYNDNKEFHWSSISDMAMPSRRKLLIFTTIYNVVLLLIILSLNEVFLGKFKPMFASLIMGFVLCMMISFILHLLNKKNSMHVLTISFFLCFGFVFAWQIPGFENIENSKWVWYAMMGSANVLILSGVIWARFYLKAHSKKEIIFGILIGLLTPIVLSLLTYGL